MRIWSTGCCIQTDSFEMSLTSNSWVCTRTLQDCSAMKERTRVTSIIRDECFFVHPYLARTQIYKTKYVPDYVLKSLKDWLEHERTERAKKRYIAIISSAKVMLSAIPSFGVARCRLCVASHPNWRCGLQCFFRSTLMYECRTMKISILAAKRKKTNLQVAQTRCSPIVQPKSMCMWIASC